MSDDEKMKVGYVVCLNSGGPDMTITFVGDNYVCCEWFDAAGNGQESEYPPECVRFTP